MQQMVRSKTSVLGLSATLSVLLLVVAPALGAPCASFARLKFSPSTVATGHTTVATGIIASCSSEPQIFNVNLNPKSQSLVHAQSTMVSVQPGAKAAFTLPVEVHSHPKAGNITVGFIAASHGKVMAYSEAGLTITGP